jgi:hypothetical protein
MTRSNALTTAAITAIAAAFISVAAVQPAAATARVAKIGVSLKTNKVSKSYLVTQIRRQARSQGVTLTDREVHQVAQAALNKLKAKGRDPLKGVIFIKTKKITFCTSWGRDATFCSHPH